MDFKTLLKKLVRNRYKDDLHSAMCYFKSGRVAYIEARFNKSLGVIIRTEDTPQMDFSTVEEVVDLFEIQYGDELIKFET